MDFPLALRDTLEAQPPPDPARTSRRAVIAFLEVLAPTAFSRNEAAALSEHHVPPWKLACVYRFSQPPDALIRPEPAGLISCRSRSWGYALQSFIPPA